MKELKIIFGLLPIMYAVLGYLMFKQEMPWVGVFLYAMSLLFGVLAFGIAVNSKKY